MMNFSTVSAAKATSLIYVITEGLALGRLLSKTQKKLAIEFLVTLLSSEYDLNFVVSQLSRENKTFELETLAEAIRKYRS